MEAQKTPIGLVIKELSDELGFKVKTLAQMKGISPQAVHDVFKRKSIGTTELEEWAEILGVSSTVILQRTKGIKEEKQVKAEIGDGYLMRRLADLEDMVQFLKAQVSEKDTQIRVLLGKSDSVLIARFAIFFIATMSKFGYTMLS